MKLGEVLVAVDFGPGSRRAARWVARHLDGDARLTLAHCLELAPAESVVWQALPPREDVVRRLRRIAADQLATLVHELPAKDSRCEILEGDPAREIATLAQEEACDLVVVGDHESEGDVWRPLGSTAERLAIASRRPVLVARGLRDEPPRTILAAVDESPPARKALAWALALGRRHGSRVIAFHAVSDWYDRRLRALGEDDEAETVQAEVVERAGRWLDELVSAHGNGGPAPGTHLRSGRPGPECLAAIDRFQADLVVVGSHGHDSFTGDALARLSRFLLLAAPCSVLLVQ